MAVTSKQESILANILTTIQGIDGTGNYNLTLDNAYRRFIHPGDMAPDKFPYCCVLDESDISFNPMTANEYTTGGSIEDLTDGWAVEVIGFVQVAEDASNAGLLQKELIKMHSDVVIAMLADRRRDGNAEATVLASTSKRVDWKRNIGGISIVFIIKYDFNPSASTPTT